MSSNPYGPPDDAPPEWGKVAQRIAAAYAPRAASLLRPTWAAGSATPGARFVLQFRDPGNYRSTLAAEAHYRQHGVFPQDVRVLSSAARAYLRQALPEARIPWSPFDDE